MGDKQAAIYAGQLQEARRRSLIDELHRKISLAGLTLVQVPGDGNCFFHALVVLGVCLDPNMARQQVVRYMRVHWASLTSGEHISETREQRCKRMEDPEVYVEGLEVKAAAKSFMITLHVTNPYLAPLTFVHGPDVHHMAWDGVNHYTPLVKACNSPASPTEVATPSGDELVISSDSEGFDSDDDEVPGLACHDCDDDDEVELVESDDLPSKFQICAPEPVVKRPRKDMQLSAPVPCVFTARDGLPFEEVAMGDGLRVAVRHWSTQNNVHMGYFSTPWTVAGGQTCISARCIRCSECIKGNGRSFICRGSWSGKDPATAAFHFQAQSKGQCRGDPVGLRRTSGSSTRDQRADVIAAAEDLSAHGPVRPGDVVQAIEAAGKDSGKADSVRGLVRRWRMKRSSISSSFKPLPPPQATPRTWTADWARYVQESRQDPDLQIRRSLPGKTITTFVIAFPNMFKFLQGLKDSGARFDHWCVQADHTFKVDWSGYTFGSIGAAYHRQIRGHWRRTLLPLLLTVRPREDKEAYLVGFEQLRELCSAFGLPMPSQLCCDHFGGIPDQFNKVFKDANVATSLWHLINNVTANQAAKGKPKLRNRPLALVIAYIHASSVLPTRRMFSTFWTIVLDRMTHVWGDGDWATYFRKEYLFSARMAGESLLCARWHHGHTSPLLAGHPPSPQAVEQSHSNLKRSIHMVRKGQPLPVVCREIRGASRKWNKAPEDKEKAFSLLATPARSAMAKPSTPSSWMLSQWQGMEPAHASAGGPCAVHRTDSLVLASHRGWWHAHGTHWECWHVQGLLHARWPASSCAAREVGGHAC